MNERLIAVIKVSTMAGSSFLVLMPVWVATYAAIDVYFLVNASESTFDAATACATGLASADTAIPRGRSILNRKGLR
jgi:hypothetical protein